MLILSSGTNLSFWIDCPLISLPLAPALCPTPSNDNKLGMVICGWPLTLLSFYILVFFFLFFWLLFLPPWLKKRWHGVLYHLFLNFWEGVLLLLHVGHFGLVASFLLFLPQCFDPSTLHLPQLSATFSNHQEKSSRILSLRYKGMMLFLFLT